MKDWKRSPEPPSMMGNSNLQSTSSSLPPIPVPLNPGAGARAGHGSLSLQSMCKAVIARNLTSLEDIGDIPYRVIKDILGECKPDQLRTIETNSPHLKEDTDELWYYHCVKDFTKLKAEYEHHLGSSRKPPKGGWRRLYRKTEEASQHQKAMAGAKIKQQYASHNAAREAKKVVVETNLVDPSARKGRRRNIGTSSSNSNVGGIKSKGQSILQKARSESKAAKRFTQAGSSSSGVSSSSSRSSRPTMRAPRSIKIYPSSFRSSTSNDHRDPMSFGMVPLENEGASTSHGKLSPISPFSMGNSTASSSGSASVVRDREVEPPVKSLDFFGSSSNVKSPTISTALNGKSSSSISNGSLHSNGSASRKRKAEEPPLPAVVVSKKKVQIQPSSKTSTSSKTVTSPTSSVEEFSHSSANGARNGHKDEEMIRPPPSPSKARRPSLQSPTSSAFNSNPVISKAAKSIFMPRSQATSQIPRSGRS